MEKIVLDLEQLAARCVATAKRLEAPEIADVVSKLLDVCNAMDAAWSQGTLGYHSRVYTIDFQDAEPGWFFDVMRGSHPRSSTRGKWAEYTYDAVKDEIYSRLGIESLKPILEMAVDVGQDFDDIRLEVLPIIDALLAEYGESDAVLTETRERIADRKSHLHRSDFHAMEIGGKQTATQDMRAVNEGPQVPPHIHFRGLAWEILSYTKSCWFLQKEIQRVARYLGRRIQIGSARMEQERMTTVFIGHGRSPLWRELKDFIADRLKLDYEEFNRDPTAGRTTVGRLGEMLDKAGVAFLVMTAEDEHGDGTVHARENVIHEVGLFQGRLGFSRAIVLLEEGCSEFSNITGLGQIRFPTGRIATIFEDVRRVLEREGFA